MNYPFPFIRNIEGEILNVSHIVKIKRRESVKSPGVHIIMAFWDDNTTEHLSVHLSETEAKEALDSLYDRLTGWQEVTDAYILTTPRPVATGPDPFNEDEEPIVRTGILHWLGGVTAEPMTEEEYIRTTHGGGPEQCITPLRVIEYTMGNSIAGTEHFCWGVYVYHKRTCIGSLKLQGDKKGFVGPDNVGGYYVTFSSPEVYGHFIDALRAAKDRAEEDEAFANG